MQNRVQFQVKIAFLILFFFLASGMWFYQLTYVKPAKECEDAGKWWYGPTRECAAPVRITDLTGRHMDDPLPGEARPQPAPVQPPAAAAPAPAATK